MLQYILTILASISSLPLFPPFSTWMNLIGLGSVSDYCLHNHHCAVVIIRPTPSFQQRIRNPPKAGSPAPSPKLTPPAQSMDPNPVNVAIPQPSNASTPAQTPDTATQASQTQLPGTSPTTVAKFPFPGTAAQPSATVVVPFRKMAANEPSVAEVQGSGATVGLPSPAGVCGPLGPASESETGGGVNWRRVLLRGRAPHAALTPFTAYERDNTPAEMPLGADQPMSSGVSAALVMEHQVRRDCW